MNLICFGNLGYVGTVLNKAFKKKFPHYVGFDIGYFKHCYLKKEKINTKNTRFDTDGAGRTMALYLCSPPACPPVPPVCP